MADPKKKGFAEEGQRTTAPMADNPLVDPERTPLLSELIRNGARVVPSATAQDGAYSPGVDEIVSSSLAASAAAPNTKVDTAGYAPSIGQPIDPTQPFAPPQQSGQGLNLGVEQPDWAWRPTQDDFGQVDVRRGMRGIPTVNAQMPFAALANRQEAVAQRKQALAQKMGAFDPYGGVGKAHDRYQNAFGKYSVAGMDQYRREVADQMFQGDLAEADQWFATDPQGRQSLARKAREFETIGAENKHWVDASINALTDAEMKGLYIPPGKKALIERYASAVDENGMPVEGVSSDQFLPMMRDVEGTLRELQYIKQAIEPGMDQAMQSMTGYAISPRRNRATGKVEISSQEVKSFEAALKHIVDTDETFVDQYYDGDKEAALEGLRAMYPTSVKDTVQMESPYTPPDSGSGGSDGPKMGGWESAPSVTVSEVAKPPGSKSFSPDASSTEFTKEDAVRKPLYEVTGGKQVPMGVKRFADIENRAVEVLPQYLEVDADGNKYVVGYVAGDKGVVTFSTSEDQPDGTVETVTKTVNTSTERPVIRIPSKGNEASFDLYLGREWRDEAPAVPKKGASKPAAGKQKIPGY